MESLAFNDFHGDQIKKSFVSATEVIVSFMLNEEVLLVANDLVVLELNKGNSFAPRDMFVAGWIMCKLTTLGKHIGTFVFI